MTVANLVAEAKRLTPAEQAELFDELVQLIDPQTAPFTLTPAQSADLKRRVEEVRSGKAVMIPGDEVIAKLKARL
jgi:putative addiction module component (TIGR02574 family)